MISPTEALRISKKLGLGYIPSAFQIRFAGFKGVLSVQPLLENKDQFKSWLSRNSNADLNSIKKLKTTTDDQLVNKTTSDDQSINKTTDIITNSGDLYGLVFRKSMNKFNSSHRVLEIVTPAKSSEFYLNRQIILILESLGISPSVFINYQDQYILDILSEIHNNFPGFIRKYCPYFPKNIISSDFLFFRKLINPILKNILDELNKKSRILIKQGKAAIGISDELDILQEDEVFIMFPSTNNGSNLNEYGSYVVPTGQAIIAKNPCIHPGDIRRVKLVDRKELQKM